MELQSPTSICEPREVGSKSVKNQGPATFIVIHIDLRYHSRPMEHTFTCPSCGEEISMVLDLSVSRHTYIEDCEVCCTPVEISYTVQDDALASFDAKTLE